MSKAVCMTVSLGMWFMPKGAWLGMKNQSDILLAPEVGQTEGHTHTHHTLSPHYMLQLWKKRAPSFMSFPSRNRNWYTALCAFISLYLFLYHKWNTLTFLTVIRCEERRYVTSVKPSRGVVEHVCLPPRAAYTVYDMEDCAEMKLRCDQFIAPLDDDSVFAEEIVFLYVGYEIPALPCEGQG